MRLVAKPGSGPMLVYVDNDFTTTRTGAAWPAAVSSSTHERRLAAASTAGGATLSAVATDTTYTVQDPATATALPPDWQLRAAAGTFVLRGLEENAVLGVGDVRLLLFGVEVSYDSRTFRTGFQNSSIGGLPGTEERVLRALYVVGRATDITLASSNPLLFHAPAEGYVVDAQGGVTLAAAAGRLTDAGGNSREVAGDVRLVGPVSVTPLAALAKDRLSVRIEPATDALDAATLAPSPEAPLAERLGPAGLVAFGAALVAFVAYWPWLKHAATALVVAPLYTRIGRDEVLEHGKREEIYTLIRANPGIHAHDVSAKAGIGWGTTVYHLKLLEDNRLVVSRRLGRYKRFYVNAGHVTQHKDAYAALRHETTAAVARAVRATPGLIQKDLCASLGLQPSLVSWHIDRLEEAGLVKKVKEGRTVRYFAGPAWEGLDEGGAAEGGATSAAA